MLNIAVILGRLTATPELKTTNSGINVTSFSVAVAWRQTAKFICDYFKKGQMIAINGSIQQRSYNDQNGNKRTAFEIVVDNANFCGSKAESNGGYSAPIPNEAPASFSNIDDGAFEEIATDDSDYPF